MVKALQRPAAQRISLANLALSIQRLGFFELRRQLQLQR
jgi:hypothetical protein